MPDIKIKCDIDYLVIENYLIENDKLTKESMLGSLAYIEEEGKTIMCFKEDIGLVKVGEVYESSIEDFVRLLRIYSENKSLCENLFQDMKMIVNEFNTVTMIILTFKDRVLEVVKK